MTERTRKGADDSASTATSADVQPPPRSILEVDEIYDALSHRRRRYLCYTLLETTEWSLTDLATKIGSWEYDLPEGELSESRREQIYTSLYHAHVPKLCELEVVRYDDETETITAAENADQVLAALEGIGTGLEMRREGHTRGEMDER